MTIAQRLTSSARQLGSGRRATAPTSWDMVGETARHQPTGDPRLDLAHSERLFG